MPYTQSALALDDAVVPTPELTCIAAYPAGGSGWVATQRHTLAPSGRRLPDDLWDGYRFECATRVRLHLPEMSLAEFRDMRDWTDCNEEHGNEDYGITESLDTPPYGRSGRR